MEITVPPRAENEWNEYRLMLISWHEDEVAGRKAVQDRLDASNLKVADTLEGTKTYIDIKLEKMNDKLDALGVQMLALKTERRVILVITGVVVPILLSVLVSLLFQLK